MGLDTAHYADVFAALGSEPRLDIMRLLFAAYPRGMTVGDLQAQVKIPNSTLSHHLEKLRMEELVVVERDRQFLWYSANATAIAALLTFLYNGCSVQKEISCTEQPHRNLDRTTEDKPFWDGFMFENFLQSVQTFASELFGWVALPVGLERFNPPAMQSIFLAQDESRRLQHRYVGTEQMLLGLLAEGTGLAAQVLATAGVELAATRQTIERYIGYGRGTPDEIPFTPRAKAILGIAVRQSQQLGHPYVGTEHLLLGILNEGQGLGIRVLEDMGFSRKTLEQQLQNAMNQNGE